MLSIKNKTKRLYLQFGIALLAWCISSILCWKRTILLQPECNVYRLVLQQLNHARKPLKTKALNWLHHRFITRQGPRLTKKCTESKRVDHLIIKVQEMQQKQVGWSSDRQKSKTKRGDLLLHQPHQTSEQLFPLPWKSKQACWGFFNDPRTGSWKSKE